MATALTWKRDGTNGFVTAGFLSETGPQYAIEKLWVGIKDGGWVWLTWCANDDDSEDNIGAFKLLRQAKSACESHYAAIGAMQ